MDNVKRVLHVRDEDANEAELLFDSAISDAKDRFSASDWVAVSPAWEWVIQQVSGQLAASNIPYTTEDVNPDLVPAGRRVFCE